MKFFTPEALTVSNLILSFFILLHLCCEFYHYISSWIENKRNKNQMEKIIKTLDKKCLKDCGGKCADKEK